MNKYNINDDLKTDLSVYHHISDITSGASYKVGNNDEPSQLFVSSFTGSGGAFHERDKSGNIFSSCVFCYALKKKKALRWVNL